jgi:hypothetical protein
MLSEDDIDFSLREPMNVKEFWEQTTNGQKQLIHSLFSEYNQKVLEYLTKELSLLQKTVDDLTDDEIELIQVKNDPRVKMISSSEDQTLLNLLQDSKSLNMLRKLAMDWKKGKSVEKALKTAQTRTDLSLNELRKKRYYR